MRVPVCTGCRRWAGGLVPGLQAPCSQGTAEVVVVVVVVVVVAGHRLAESTATTIM